MLLVDLYGIQPSLIELQLSSKIELSLVTWGCFFSFFFVCAVLPTLFLITN